jgi:2-keto-4-pentenoate hydratase/2-oxohepta-3-ene-1,7-dioic acid hydratase in catechol pathway
MIFGVRQLIAFVSRGITLYPGDVISTGTPSGIGQAQSPPVYLRAGDEVVVEVDKIGRLSNPIAASL